MLRENVLRDLANWAATDPEFLRRARTDLEGTLARYGYRLAGEEIRRVEGLRHRAVSMSDAQYRRRYMLPLHRLPDRRRVIAREPTWPD